MDKNELRKWAKNERSKLDMKALGEKLAQKLRQTKEYKQAKNVMIFYPLENEVNLLSLLEDRTKTFYLPKIDGDNLLCCRYANDILLCESCFHTMEPESEQIIFAPDLVVVPALAVDKKNYRLGYGKGFYDRFLSQFKTKMKTIVCIPKELIVETICPDDFDISVDIVITD